MYAITGATGHLGRLVTAALLGRVAPGEIVALVRDPAAAADLNPGLQVRPFDYDQPDRLVAALDGVTRLLFISSDTPETRLGQHRAVVEAASSVPLELIAYTSILHADDNPISLAETHRATERMIAASGLRHAFLRNGWYTENYLIGADAAVEHGVLLGSSGQGTISAASRADYADAAAAVLIGDVTADQTYELAGDEAFTLADLAAALEEAAGRPVAYRDLPEARYAEALAGAGLPKGFAAALAEYSAGAASGILADHSRTLRRLIGRPTEPMRDLVRRSVSRRVAGETAP